MSRTDRGVCCQPFFSPLNDYLFILMSLYRLHFGDDANLCRPQELDDVADERTVGHLLLDLVDGIEQAGLSMEHEAVGVGNVLQQLVIDTVLVCHLHVDTTEFSVLGTDDIGWHILGEGGACLYHGALSDACLGILDDGTGEDDAVFDGAVAGNLGAIAEDAAVADLGVMADVCTFHEEVVVADDGLAAMVCGTVDDDVLTDDVVVADDAFRLLAAEVEILRQRTDDGTLVHFVPCAHAGAVQDADEGEDDASVANLHVILYIDKGEYLTVVADFRLGRYLSFGTYFTCHNYQLSIIN